LHINHTIREIIESSLDYYGIKTKKTARSYIAMARENSGLSDEDAMAIALE